jgi:hypothetical protein
MSSPILKAYIRNTVVKSQTMCLSSLTWKDSFWQETGYTELTNGSNIHSVITQTTVHKSNWWAEFPSAYLSAPEWWTPHLDDYRQSPGVVASADGCYLWSWSGPKHPLAKAEPPLSVGLGWHHVAGALLWGWPGHVDRRCVVEFLPEWKQTAWI